MTRIRTLQYAALALAPIMLACSEQSPTDIALPPVQKAVVLPAFAQEQSQVCVNGPAGSYSFTVGEVDAPNIATLHQASPFNLIQDQCVLVATTAAPGGTFGTNATITVTSVGMPSGVGFDDVTRHTAVFHDRNSPSPTSTTTVTDPGPGSSFDLGLEIGVILVFNFSEREIPGGQGCTPGYWKQSQHFGNWTAPYTPSTLFDAVFDDAFPGKTLLQVVGQGGGGLNALGRHTVAALLNAASGDVASGFTPAQVIAAFNAAFASGDYEGQKNIFEAANEQGCPLGRAP